jgi:DNA-binding beta-propeller fold protein YncE
MELLYELHRSATVCLVTHSPHYARYAGADPDVLAFDAALQRLYVSAESGIITIFDERERSLQKVGEGVFAPNAHSVAVDPSTHRIYFPLQNINGKPVLRIAVPSDK